MRLIEKSGTLQILDSLRESSVKEDVSDLVDTEDEILLGSEEEEKKEDKNKKVKKSACEEEKEDLKEAEQTIDIFVNPERDYKITDVTMLEPIDDGDVRAIDMQSILIGLDESLTEKYGAKWGEFNIQSSRTPRGKISENDISYVLHVLNINGHQEILNYNTKGIGRIREAFVTDSRGKVLSSKRCAVSRIPKFFMEATENYIERYNDEDENVYTIEVWDSRYDREEGFGYTIGETFKDRDEAVAFARKLFNDEYKECVEVQGPNGGAVVTIGPEGENFWNEDLEEAVKAKETKEELTEDAVLPNNGYIDQTGLNLVSDERIQASLKRRVQRLKARQKLLKAKRTFDKKGNVAPVDEKNTHGKEVADSDIGQETEPITDTKIKESVVSLDTDTGTVDIDGNVSHVTLDQDGTMTAVSGADLITTTDNSIQVLPSEETMIADDSVLEPVEDEMGAEDIIEPEGEELAPEEAEMAPEEASEDEVVETGDIAMAEPVPASELEENAKVVKENVEDNNKFWNSGVKIGDKFKNGNMDITILDLNQPKNYIIVNRGGGYEPIVAAWHPELSDNGELVWGQGHYFDNLDQASAYVQNLSESLKESLYEDDSVFTGFRDSGQDEGLLGTLWFEVDGKPENMDLSLIDGEYRLTYGMFVPDNIKAFVDSQGGYKNFLDSAVKYVEGYRKNLEEWRNQPVDYSDLEESATPRRKRKIKEAKEVEEKVESDIDGVETKEETIEEELVPTAIFHRKPSSTDSMRKEEENKVVTAKSNYTIKDVKEVGESEYEDLCNNLQKERDYIKAFADSVEVDNSVTFNCLEVKGPNGSLLIDPSGYGYARYCAFKDEAVEEPTEEIEAEEEIIEEPVEEE